MFFLTRHAMQVESAREGIRRTTHIVSQSLVVKIKRMLAVAQVYPYEVP
jgi:hypothetical protein